MIPPVVDWAFLDAIYTARTATNAGPGATAPAGAFISERFLLFTYGFYPEPERWRVNLSFILLIIAVIPVLYDRVPLRKPGLYFTALFPFIAAYLLVGGEFPGLEPAAYPDGRSSAASC